MLRFSIFWTSNWRQYIRPFRLTHRLNKHSTGGGRKYEKSRVLPQVRERICFHYAALSTEKICVNWTKIFIHFQVLRHLDDAGNGTSAFCQKPCFIRAKRVLWRISITTFLACHPNKEKGLRRKLLTLKDA